jgi:hypothetical protein
MVDPREIERANFLDRVHAVPTPELPLPEATTPSYAGLF